MGNSLDPRAVKTRAAIIEAFNALIMTKDFNNISIKDITEKANINRATFYAHFLDKYDLLDQVLSKTIKHSMEQHFTCHDVLNEQTIAAMITSIATVHDSMHNECRRGYNTFQQMLKDKTIAMLEDVLTTIMHDAKKATLVAWAIYGAYSFWDRQPKQPLHQHTAQIAPSIIRLIET